MQQNISKHKPKKMQQEPLEIVGFLCNHFAGSTEGAAHSAVHQDPRTYTAAK